MNNKNPFPISSRDFLPTLRKSILLVQLRKELRCIPLTTLHFGTNLQRTRNNTNFLPLLIRLQAEIASQLNAGLFVIQSEVSQQVGHAHRRRQMAPHVFGRNRSSVGTFTHPCLIRKPTLFIFYPMLTVSANSRHNRRIHGWIGVTEQLVDFSFSRDLSRYFSFSRDLLRYFLLCFSSQRKLR